MDDRAIRLMLGSLLHDIGKFLSLYPGNESGEESGEGFLKESGIEEAEILEQIRTPHGEGIPEREMYPDSLAYITTWAARVADGGENNINNPETEHDAASAKPDARNTYVPLYSIFNRLNGNDDNQSYELDVIRDDGRMNPPSPGRKTLNTGKWKEIRSNIARELREFEPDITFLNHLLGVLETNLSFVSASADPNRNPDIALYDEMKITSAIASCVYYYMRERGIEDYREYLLPDGKTVRSETEKEPFFLMCGWDLSGIQEYIYKVGSEDALKLLRAKSFYLEILLEHVVDELLERLGLFRANQIYNGGGNAYLLLPNTAYCRKTMETFGDELKKWTIENFGIDLYVAHGYAECCANDLMNLPEGSYAEIFARLSRKVSNNKSARYTAAEILGFNNRKPEQSTRECRVCGATDHLMGEGLCERCASLIGISADILKPDRFVTIVSGKPEQTAVSLPFGKYLLMESEAQLRNRMRDAGYVRSYSKNRLIPGLRSTTRIWIGDYNNGNTFHDLAAASEGIQKLGVLRADVDNLGQAIIHGFDRKDGTNLGSLTRNACLSRKLTVFFKHHINYILRNGVEQCIRGTEESWKRSEYPDTSEDLMTEHPNITENLRAEHLNATENPVPDHPDAPELPARTRLQNTPESPAEPIERHILVVYSGGDDMFLVGAWNDILNASLDIQRRLGEFTQHTLTVSAGLSIFPEKFPVGPMAGTTGDLEDAAKEMDGKAAVALFSGTENRYKWTAFAERVIGEKFTALDRYFSRMPDKGMSFMYRLMSYVRAREDKINLARFAYMLGRIEPGKGASQEVRALHREFSREMYDWIRSDEDSRELLTAIYIYVYLHRNDRGENQNGR